MARSHAHRDRMVPVRKDPGAEKGAGDQEEAEVDRREADVQGGLALGPVRFIPSWRILRAVRRSPSRGKLGWGSATAHSRRCSMDWPKARWSWWDRTHPKRPSSEARSIRSAAV